VPLGRQSRLSRFRDWNFLPATPPGAANGPILVQLQEQERELVHVPSQSQYHRDGVLANTMREALPRRGATRMLVHVLVQHSDGAAAK
jgi:hypothetical protein